jgi:hypothetical protein
MMSALSWVCVIWILAFSRKRVLRWAARTYLAANLHEEQVPKAKRELGEGANVPEWARFCVERPAICGVLVRRHKIRTEVVCVRAYDDFEGAQEVHSHFLVALALDNLLEPFLP